MRPHGFRRLEGTAFLKVSLALALGSAGCRVTPPTPAPTPLPAAYAWTAGAGDDSVEGAWWRGYGDPALDSIVALARAANTDIAAAVGRLAESRATLRGAGGAIGPQLAANASATRSQQVIGSFGAVRLDALGASLEASWELDLAGRLRADRAAAASELVGAGYDLADLRRTITGRVVRGWHDALGATARLRVTQAALVTLEETRALVASRQRAGLATALDVERAAAAAEETRAQLPAIHAEWSDAVGELAVLAGSEVATISVLLEGGALGSSLPVVPSGGVPADQLRRRPDVRRAERRVIAAAIRIAGARAALAPSLTLGGSVGVNRTNGATASTWSLGPSLSLPFLDRAARARVDERRAQLVQRESEWRGAVIGAVRDVEVAFARARDESERLRALEEAVRRRISVESLAGSRWRAGSTDFRDVLDARRTRLDAEQAFVRQRVAVAQAVATMHVALGGGELGSGVVAGGDSSGGRFRGGR